MKKDEIWDWINKRIGTKGKLCTYCGKATLLTNYKNCTMTICKKCNKKMEEKRK